ncbi:hypothetical protein DFH09DRAFT_1284171 [Mycena vulgaris]|nr:hypothetical protein DFH09DRAFT_1284171 [Mycena vulgaris]
MTNEEWQLKFPGKLHARDIYIAVGQVQFEHATHIMGEDDLKRGDQPEGCVEAVIRSAEIIHGIMRKLDGKPSAKKITGGAFHAFIGAVWMEVLDESMEELLAWLEPMFLPLRSTTGAECFSYPHVPTLPLPRYGAGRRVEQVLQDLNDVYQYQISTWTRRPRPRAAQVSCPLSSSPTRVSAMVWQLVVRCKQIGSKSVWSLTSDVCMTCSPYLRHILTGCNHQQTPNLPKDSHASLELGKFPRGVTDEFQGPLIARN